MNYSQPSREFSSEFFKLVALADRVVITAHKSPDEDSIGSVLSVYEILTTKYPDKDFEIIYSGVWKKKYQTFKNYNKIRFVVDIAEEINGADLLIRLDSNQFRQFSEHSERLRTVPITSTCFST